MRKSKIYVIAILLICLVQELQAQEILKEDFNLWSVGTSYWEDPKDTSQYFFYDEFIPHNANIWSSIQDSNLLDILMQGLISGTVGDIGVEPFYYSRTEAAAVFDLQSIFSLEGLEIAIKDFDWSNSYVLAFDVRAETLHGTQEILQIEVVGQNHEVHLPFKVANSPIMKSVALDFSEIASTTEDVTLRLFIERAKPNSSKIYLDNLCLNMVDASKTQNTISAKSKFEVTYSSSAISILNKQRKNITKVYIFDSIGNLIREQTLDSDQSVISIPSIFKLPKSTYYLLIEEANSSLNVMKFVHSY